MCSFPLQLRRSQIQVGNSWGEWFFCSKLSCTSGICYQFIGLACEESPNKYLQVYFFQLFCFVFQGLA